MLFRSMSKAGWDEFDALDATVFRSVKGEQRRRLLEVYSEKRKPITPKKVDNNPESVPDDIKTILDNEDEKTPF